MTSFRSSGHHLSNHSHKEPQHITLYVASAIGWGAVPRRSNACAHIYSVNHQVDGGYTGYWIKNSNTNHFQSNSVSSKLQRALDNVKLSPKLVCGVCGGFGCGCEEELEEEDGDDDDEDDEDYEDYYDDYGEYQDYQDYEDYEEEEEAEEEEEEA